MTGAANVLIWAGAILVTMPVLMLAPECLAGSWARRARRFSVQPPPFTVLMPAHDEASGIAEPIRAVRAQLRARDELIVIADNCSDDTAAIARRLGAHVVERHDLERRGKGYALEAGRPHVTDSPGRIVIVVDADCIATPHALQRLASTSSRRRAVVQGAYLLAPPIDAPPVVRISAFAFLIKNLVRQLGLRRMAGAALLQGSGMAFPQTIFRRLDWCAHSLVEDLDLGVRLLASGHAVTFDDGALFLSGTASREATAGQRRRWEHGMMQSMGRNVPMLLRAAVARPRLLVMAIDQMVLPATVLIAIASAALLLLLGTGLWGPGLLLLSALTLLALSLLAVWSRFGHRLAPRATLGEVVRYVFWKLPLAVQFLTRRERQWLRTGREP